MGKTIIQGSILDFIVDEITQPVKDGAGKFIPETDNPDAPIKVKGRVHSIYTFVSTGKGYQKITLTALDIKKLYECVVKVESRESFEIWDEF